MRRVQFALFTRHRVNLISLQTNTLDSQKTSYRNTADNVIFKQKGTRYEEEIEHEHHDGHA